MPKVHRRTSKTPPARLASRGKSRVLIVLCIVLPPLVLTWKTLFSHSLLPADLLTMMPPWKEANAPLIGFWNALIWDSLGQYFPWRDFAARVFQSGYIPLWNPFQFCGLPFLANSQSALFYPLNLIFWLTDTRRAFGLSGFLHLALAGWFTYLFLRAVRLRRFGATVGAVTFALNGYFLTWIFLPTVVSSAIWLPLALLFAEKFFRRGKPAFAVGAGAAVGLSALAGHPQIFLLCTLFFGFYFIARGIFLKQWLRLAGGILLTGGFAALLAVVQLLPLAELLRFSHRAPSAGAERYDFYLSWALPWHNLVTLLLPDFFGNPGTATFWGKGNYAEFCAYAGILPFALALIAVRYGRGFHARFFAIFAAVWLLCALGTPLNWFFFHFIPGMSRAGSPARLLLLYLSSVAFLAGIGANWVTQAYSEKGAAWLRPRLLAVILVVAILAVGLAFFSRALLPYSGEFTLQDVFGDAKPNITLLGSICLVSIILIFAMGARSRQVRNALAGAVVFLIVADLLIFGFRYIRTSPRAEVFPSTGVTRFLQENADGGRFLALSPEPLEEAWPASDLPEAVYLLRGMRPFPRALLPPNSAMVYSLRDVLGYDSVYLANYRALVGELEGRDPSPAANGNLLLASSARRDMLPLFGVRYLLSLVPLEGRDLRLVYDGEVKVYEVISAVSRAWAADGSFSPGVAMGEAEIVEDGINHVRVEASLTTDGYLVLADAFYPGWHAFVGGQEMEIIRANGAFRAVALPAGSHQVDFHYRPAVFKIGLFAFLLALSIAAGCSTNAILLRRRGFEKR